MMSNGINAEAMKNLRDAVMLSRRPYAQIAKDVGVNRKTIPKMLLRDDLPIGMYFKVAQAIGADPFELLKNAESQTSAAIASTDKKTTGV